MSSAMHKRQLVLCLVGIMVPVLAGIGCSNIAVQTAWAPQTAAQSSLGSSFAWRPTTPQNQGKPHDPEVDKLIRGVIENQLVVKGYEQHASEDAGFWVDYRVTTETAADPRAVEPYEKYERGTLVVYVIDPRTDRWIWRAWVVHRLNETATPEQKRKNLAQTVKDMFQAFPNSSK